MTPTLIGYFPKRTIHGDPSLTGCFPGLGEVCNVACASPEPKNWHEVWMDNEMNVFDTEAQAWAIATDLANLKRLFDQLDKNWDGVPGSMQRTLDNYIKRHVLLPGSLVNCDGEWRHWDLYAYRLFPVRFRYGNQEPFLLPPLQVQPLPTDYESLGYDAISRYAGTNFEHSPLFCQGFYREAGANRYTLLDKIDDAFHWAQYFSKDQYNSDGNYCGPAEPGPYFVAEVLRKRRSCLSP